MKSNFVLLLLLLAIAAQAQTVYVPSGTSGIGSSANGNVGVGSGSSTPNEQLHIFGNLQIGSTANGSAGSYNINMAPGSALTNSGNGRSLTITAGSTDNAAGKVGGLLTLNGGTANSPATQFGHVALSTHATSRVGVGLTAPTVKFEVNGSGGSVIDLKVNGRIQTGDAAGNQGGVIVNSAATMFYGQYDATKMGIWNNNGWRMIFDNAGNIGVGVVNPTDQFEVVNANRRISLNATIPAVPTGGLLAISRPSDGAKTIYIGTTGGSTNYDNVIYGQSGNSELRLVSAGLLSQGFGFYINTDAATSFASARPTPSVKIDGYGNMGIGLATPSSRLHVIGTGGTSTDIRTNGRISTGDANNQGGVWVNSAATMFVGQNSATKLGFYNNAAWRLVVDNTGNVGIGTESPDSKLAVKGTVHANEVKVDLLGAIAPDYVFASDYALPSLETIKSYITQHHHLPEIPSAKEMEANGIELGDMNLKLLKKIEELTLYMIEMKEENQALKSRVEALEKK